LQSSIQAAACVLTGAGPCAHPRPQPGSFGHQARQRIPDRGRVPQDWRLWHRRQSQQGIGRFAGFAHKLSDPDNNYSLTANCILMSQRC
jgi:hypothetical protein